jgi:RND family efflux transporter MFP subunit
MKGLSIKSVSLWLILVSGLAASGAVWWASARAKLATANLETVRRGDLALEVPVLGSLGAARSIDITAPISNDPHMFKIAQMIPEGTRVEAGEMVLEMDTQEINQKMTEYRAELEKNEEELKKRRLEQDVRVRDLRVALEEARVKLETARHKLDADASLMSALERKQFQVEFDQAELRTQLLAAKQSSVEQMAKAELSVLENNIAKIRIRVEQVAERQRECTIRAPIGGTLIYKLLWGNTKRKVGDQTCHHEVIVQIPDLTTLRFEAMIDESDVGRVQAGQSVEIKLDALPEEKLTGHVAKVGTVLRMRRWDNPVKVVDAIIELDKRPDKLNPGMTASGRIEVAKLRGALLVPARAVEEKAGQVLVKVPGLDGRVEQRVIKAGRRNQQFVEVLEGLDEGEKVIL